MKSIKKNTGESLILLLMLLVTILLLLMTLGLVIQFVKVDEYKPDKKLVPIKLTVGILDNNIDTVSVILAKELGYFEAENLNVEFKTIKTLKDGTDLLDNNELDI